ncbi:Asp-tRNA(Asn)/Glu-tRNA(Gln) amidotransferase GatCAB subunit C [Methanosarcinales archaeon]|nr:MAG: Asp-tRNA(Asn)/Glu-tRNA(Gln) amidotransferase GatCAB subunit C [Methanosarcinales archaeon]
MSVITKDVLEHLLWLSKLSVSEEEKERILTQLNSVLEYFSILDELEIEDVEPMWQVAGLVNVFREDEVEPSLPQEEVLKNAPKTENGFIKTPRMM